jgi:large subunit ribosomal protein L5
MANATTNNLQPKYKNELRAKLQKDLNLRNIHQVPEISKITLNVGLGKSKDDKRMKETAANTLRKITGQEPVETFAKKSIAGFKIRAGQNKIGIKVTLRGAQMYEFLERLINVVLPQTRDFHGVKKTAFDKSGNFSLGIKEQSVFSELAYEDTITLHGLQINIVIKNGDAESSRALLQAFGMPFTKERK